MSDKAKFISHLVDDLKPRTQWRPYSRSFFWVLGSFCLTILVMLLVRPFRPSFFSQLIEHPLLLLEIISAFLLSISLVYAYFVHLVPGEKVSKQINAVSLVSGVVFISTIGLSFFISSPIGIDLGSRPFCIEEVFLYSFLSVSTFLFFLYKADYHISYIRQLSLGFAVGLIPAALMEVACVYSPKHALIAHYGPILFICGFSTVLPSLKRILFK